VGRGAAVQAHPARAPLRGNGLEPLTARSALGLARGEERSHAQLEDVLFSVGEHPIFVSVKSPSGEKRISVPDKKAIVHGTTSRVLGIVSRGLSAGQQPSSAGVDLPMLPHRLSRDQRVSALERTRAISVLASNAKLQPGDAGTFEVGALIPSIRT
jgi:hypothetical protein